MRDFLRAAQAWISCSSLCYGLWLEYKALDSLGLGSCKMFLRLTIGILRKSRPAARTVRSLDMCSCDESRGYLMLSRPDPIAGYGTSRARDVGLLAKTTEQYLMV